MNDTKRLNALIGALDLDSDSELIKTVIQNVGKVTVEDIGEVKNGYEVFMRPHSFTGRELENLQEIFEVKEIGIYGDPEIPDEKVYFHMIVSL